MYAVTVQLIDSDILLTAHREPVFKPTNGLPPTIQTIAKLDQNGLFTPIGEATLKYAGDSISEVGGSKAGTQYIIYSENDTNNQYIEGHNKKGERLFKQILGKFYEPSSGTSYTYQSILVDENGCIYLTGYIDGIDINVFIEKRNSKTGKLVWSVKPFDQQNLDASGSYWSIRTGEHPSILLNNNQLLTSASGWFPGIRAGDDTKATYLAKINLTDGSTASQHYVNEDASYATEFLTTSDSTIFTNESGSFLIEGISPIQPTYSMLGSNKKARIKM